MQKLYQKKIPLLDCGHEYIREVLYGRWKIVLLYHIFNGIKRPGELERKIPQATRRVLDVQLSQLLNHGLIVKNIFKETIPHVEYEMTELGKTLIPVIMVMIKWGNDNKGELRKVIQIET